MLFAALAILCAAPLAAQSADPTLMVPKVASGEITYWPDMDGGVAGPMDVWIWTPPGYGEGSAAGQRYPVLYMHDGHNLFDRKLTAYDQEWKMDETIARMAAQGDLREWIVVGIESPDDRYSGMFPQKLLPLLPPELRLRIAALQKGMGDEPAFFGDAYLDFIVGTVRPKVERQFMTLDGPENRAVMGASMGGLAALYAIAEYPDLFGSAAALSTTISLASPSEKGVDHPAMAKEVAKAMRTYIAATGMTPERNRLYFDHGTGTDEGAFTPYMAEFGTMMHELGWVEGPSFQYRTFAGAQHNETAWSQRVDIPLAFLDSKDP